jgi:hypothetical protein
MVVLFIATVAVMIYSYRVSHPKVEIPAENRRDFARVAILLDGTRSVRPENFPLMKRIVQEKILPSLGVDDVAVAYDVDGEPDGEIDHEQNAVFGIFGDQMPGHQEDRRLEILDVLERNRERPTAEAALYDLVGELAGYHGRVESIRSAWAERVEAREEPAPKGSDICTPLGELGRFLQQGDPGAERWLFILSDLQDTNPPHGCRFDDTFPNATIVLIYPFGPSHPSWKRIESFWREFFSNQDLERVPFSAALADGTLLPPNPLAGLDGDIGTQWEHARPMITPALLAAAGLTLLLAVPVGFSFSRPRADAPGGAAEGRP